MSARRIVAALLVLSMIAGSRGFAAGAEAQPAPPGSEATPPRISYIHGEVSFWRPGAQDWTPARINLPLAPGDVLYTGGGNVEVQIKARAFVRAAEGTQLGLDNQEPDYIQFRVTDGHAALDLRELTPGQTVELDTPNAAFTIERPGYYRVSVAQDSTTFRTHRGGSATMTPAGGQPTPIAANQQIVVTGTDAPRVEAGPAPQLSAWDRWNYQRTEALMQSASARYVPQAVYGTEALDQYGSWRSVEAYGPVWVPSAVTVGWVPYSTGRWIWDPRFGWTWLDDAPWGWAPYHYGRWVFIGSYWAWAPGPIIVQPVYAPALVVFLGGGVTVSFGRPLYWAPLAWGEPVIPWWGRPGYVGVASWHGWGGPRVVNNVVINRTTTVNVTNITVYNNVHVTNAVVGVPADRFGRGPTQATRIDQAQARQLKPVRGALEVTPVAASVAPAAGTATARPPATIRERPVVATRAPHDVRPALRAQGLATTAEPAPAPAPKLVPSPKAVAPPSKTQAPGAARPPDNGVESKKEKPAAIPPQQKKDKAPTPPTTATPPQAPPPAPGVQSPGQRGREQARPEQKKDKAPTPPTTATPPPAPLPPAVPGSPGQRGREEARPEQKKDKAPTPPTATTPPQAPPPAPGVQSPGQRGREQARPPTATTPPQAPPPPPAVQNGRGQRKQEEGPPPQPNDPSGRSERGRGDPAR